jgi:hypothetical protein
MPLSESSSRNPPSKAEKTSALADDTTSDEEEARQDEEEMKPHASASRPQFVRFYLVWSFWMQRLFHRGSVASEEAAVSSTAGRGRIEKNGKKLNH